MEITFDQFETKIKTEIKPLNLSEPLHPRTGVQRMQCATLISGALFNALKRLDWRAKGKKAKSFSLISQGGEEEITLDTIDVKYLLLQVSLQIGVHYDAAKSYRLQNDLLAQFKYDFDIFYHGYAISNS